MAQNETKNEKRITSKQMAVGIAPRKVVDIANEIRGMKVSDAMRFLTFNTRKASGIIINIVKSGVANGSNTFGVNPNDMYIEDIQIGPGPTRKSGRIAGKSTFKPIKKRTTNIEVILSSKPEEKTDE